MRDLLRHRVWDVEEKTMYYDTGVVGDYLILDPIHFDGCLSSPYCVYMDEKRYKIMPYVQKDDDLYPLYLGDIIQLANRADSSQIGLIIYEHGTYFYMTRRQIRGRAELLKIPVMGLMRFTIIGNVYETGHLLIE